MASHRQRKFKIVMKMKYFGNVKMITKKIILYFIGAMISLSLIHLCIRAYNIQKDIYINLREFPVLRR